MIEVKSKETVKEPIKMQITGTPDKIVPKVCTTINFGVTGNNSFVLTLTYNEAPDQTQTIIERVMIEHEHAKNVSKVLSDLLDKIEKK